MNTTQQFLDSASKAYYAGSPIISDEQFDRLAIGLECSNSPCHSPNGKVQVTVHFSPNSQFRSVTASAQEYFSPWV
jgi:NAD-dependent DNA ligase